MYRQKCRLGLFSSLGPLCSALALGSMMGCGLPSELTDAAKCAEISARLVDCSQGQYKPTGTCSELAVSRYDAIMNATCEEIGPLKDEAGGERRAAMNFRLAFLGDECATKSTPVTQKMCLVPGGEGDIWGWSWIQSKLTCTSNLNLNLLEVAYCCAEDKNYAKTAEACGNDGWHINTSLDRRCDQIKVTSILGGDVQSCRVSRNVGMICVPNPDLDFERKEKCCAQDKNYLKIAAHCALVHPDWVKQGQSPTGTYSYPWETPSPPR